jgi:hypothetical protein
VADTDVRNRKRMFFDLGNQIRQFASLLASFKVAIR